MENTITEQKIFDLNNIRLVVGLGNIGNEFIGTRHNVGFELLDNIVAGQRFKEDKDLFSDFIEKNFGEHKLLLLKPRTMMNLSGKAVIAAKNFYKFKPEEILIVHDDLDIQLGAYKMHYSKGPKIHNGILSIENRLGTPDFWRLRIGVDNRDVVTRNHMTGAAYVLGRFKADERNLIIKTYNDIINQYFLI